MYQVYIWSGRNIPDLKDFYSVGLYVAGAESKEEAIDKLFASQRIDQVEQMKNIIEKTKNRITELKNGADSSYSKGIELERLENYLKSCEQVPLAKLLENEVNDEKWFKEKLMKHEPEIVYLEDLAVYEEAVG